LDVEHESYAPGNDFRETGADLAHFDVDLEKFAKAHDPKNLDALNGARRVQRSIASKVPRGRHRVTSCLAMELLLSDEERLIVLLEKFGVPRRLGTWAAFTDTTKALVRRILTDNRLAARGVLAGIATRTEVVTPVRASAAKVEHFARFQLNLPEDFDYAAAMVSIEKRSGEKQESKAQPRNGKGKAASKRDYSREAESNEAVGRAGEEFVIAYEKHKLRSHPDLAKQIRWVAESDDSAGFDVLSYDPDGSEIYIEVKSTTGKWDSEFYMSINELTIAGKLGDSYQIYRVFDLGSSPKICKIAAPISDAVDLEAVTYKATFK
jgi:hypothetical protein